MPNAGQRALQTQKHVIADRARRHSSPGEAVYHLGRLTASYVHLYFPSNPDTAASLFLP